MNLHYIKLSCAHPDYAATVEQLRADFAKATGGNGLSVNISKDGTAAWIKVVADHGVAGPILLADLPEDQAQTVRDEVSAESWTGPRPQRPGRPK